MKQETVTRNHSHQRAIQPLSASPLQRGQARKPVQPYSKARRRKPFQVEPAVGYAIILVVALLFLFPLAYLVNVALQSPADFSLNPSSITKTINLGNFARAWDQGNFSSYFYNTIFYTLVSSTLSTIFSLLLAFPIARGYVKWSRWWYLLFVLSLFLPSGLIPQFQLMLKLGLYNTQIGYILLQSGAVGLGPFLIVGYLKSVPRELDEAAVMDGCGYFRLIWSVIGPLTLPVLVTVFLLHAIGVWNDIIGPTIYLSDQSYYPV